jgi:hypothetical protein
MVGVITDVSRVRGGFNAPHAGTSMPSAGGVHVMIRALCRWHFQPGGGPEHCRACRDDDLPRAEASPEPTDGSAPTASTA